MLRQTTSKILFLTAIIAFLISGIQTGPSLGIAKLQAAPLPADRVIIYQFHRRFRCDSCYKLEVAINEALQTHFPEEVKEGKVIFKVVDLDAEGSDPYEKKYDFFYNTVIVVDIENGEELRFKNLEEVWGLVEQKDVTIEFIRSHITDYL